MSHQPLAVTLVAEVPVRRLLATGQLLIHRRSLFQLATACQRPCQHPQYVVVVLVLIVQLEQQLQRIVIRLKAHQTDGFVQHVAGLLGTQQLQTVVARQSLVVVLGIEQAAGLTSQGTLVVGLQAQCLLIIAHPQIVLHVAHLLSKGS